MGHQPLIGGEEGPGTPGTFVESEAEIGDEISIHWSDILSGDLDSEAESSTHWSEILSDKEPTNTRWDRWSVGDGVTVDLRTNKIIRITENVEDTISESGSWAESSEEEINETAGRLEISLPFEDPQKCPACEAEFHPLLP